MAELVRNGSNTPAPQTTEGGVTVLPRVDVLETEHDVLVLADMPGVKTEDVDIRFEKGELSLHARRSSSKHGQEPEYREYQQASYHRAFAVAESIAADRISAELKGGVLTVRLPKIEAAKPRRIAVKG